MKFEECGIYLFVTIEPLDWKTKGKTILEIVKSIPGRTYYPADKSWRILKHQRPLLAEFLPPFTIEEELEGEQAIQDLWNRLDGISYNPQQ